IEMLLTKGRRGPAAAGFLLLRRPPNVGPITKTPEPRPGCRAAIEHCPAKPRTSKPSAFALHRFSKCKAVYTSERMSNFAPFSQLTRPPSRHAFRLDAARGAYNDRALGCGEEGLRQCSGAASSQPRTQRTLRRSSASGAAVAVKSFACGAKVGTNAVNH